MADLSYDDVVRATQSATRDILNSVQHIQGQVQQMGNVQKGVNQIAAVQQQLIMCNRQLQSMTERIDQLSRQAVPSAADPRITLIVQEVAELKVRFASVERFASDVSDYLRSQEG